MKFIHWLLELFDMIEAKTKLVKTRKELELAKEYLESKGHLKTFETSVFHEQLVEQNNSLQEEIQEKKEQVIFLDNKILLESSGFYRPLYNLANSEQYKNKLTLIQDNQANSIKNGNAATCSQQWALGEDRKAGDKMVKDNIKLILRSFNNECESAILKVKHNSFDTGQKRINKAYETLNKLGKMLSISIEHSYLNLKIQELHCVYEYELKKQEEKEEIIAQRERLKEEAKLERELEEAKAVNEKEKTHFNKQLAALNKKLADSKDDDEKFRIYNQKSIIEMALEKCLDRDKELDYREQNAGAGYVYIISNIGAFGENVFKIGVTRRLEPQDRIDELGNASVPFRFDVHTMIFSDKAFELEKSLHNEFKDKRVNLINNRKEFFKVSLGEINEVLKKKYNKHFELVLEAPAEHYRESEKLRQKESN